MSIKKENTKESIVLMQKNTSDKNFKYYWNEIIRALIVTKLVRLIDFIFGKSKSTYKRINIKTIAR